MPGGGVLKKIMPARARAQEPDAGSMSTIVDIDDFVSKPVGFRFQGRLYRVEPVSTERFMELTRVLEEIGSLTKMTRAGRETHEDEIYGLYHRFISSLCPEFTMATLKAMQPSQLHALVNLIIKHATGQAMSLDDEKKKTLMT